MEGNAGNWVVISEVRKALGRNGFLLFYFLPLAARVCFLWLRLLGPDDKLNCDMLIHADRNEKKNSNLYWSRIKQELNQGSAYNPIYLAWAHDVKYMPTVT